MAEPLPPTLSGTTSFADGLLTYQFSIEGEEASDAIITNVEFLNGRGRSTSSTPSSPTASGTAALTLGHDNKTDRQ